MSAPDNDNASLNVTELLLNTTEQILQKVNDLLTEAKEQNNEYNWDPATFAVTLIIGIIATFFAGLAIVQGLLAAGPGRLKCGTYALGPWSQLTTRKFDWSELRFRTVAYTPIISWRAMNMQREKYEQIESLFDHSFHITFFGKGMFPKRSLRKGLDEFFPSSWLALLTRLGVDHPELWGRKATGADFVPTELPSVLAYGNFRDIINLVLIVSKEAIRLEFDTESHLPSVQANDVSLSFRIHPLLGLVGSFELYETYSTYEQGTNAELPAAMDLAVGLMHVHTASFEGALRWCSITHPSEFGHLVDFFTGLTIDHCQCRSTEAVSEETAVFMRRSEAAPWYRPISEIKEAGLHKFFILCDFKPPSDGPIVFPRGSFRILHVLQPFLLQSNFWLQGVSFYGVSPASDTCHQKLTVENFRTSLMAVAGSGKDDLSMIIHDNSFSSCCKFLASLSSQLKRDEASGRALSMPCPVRGKMAENKTDLAIAQDVLKGQIDSIDYLISKVNRNAWDCRVRVMSVMASLTHLRLGDAVLESSASTSDVSDSQEDGKPSKKKTMHSSLEPFLYRCVPEFHRRGVQDALKELQGVWEQVTVSKQLRGLDAKHPLDDLVIYRTILSAMLLETAVDNSAVVDNKIYDRVIPIL